MQAAACKVADYQSAQGASIKQLHLPVDSAAMPQVKKDPPSNEAKKMAAASKCGRSVQKREQADALAAIWRVQAPICARSPPRAVPLAAPPTFQSRASPAHGGSMRANAIAHNAQPPLRHSAAFVR
eukprot:3253304-Pleurochrysis_carterae.AAC.1